ncbi:MAG: MFS transporter, partial [Candidatus Lokiarchaeota archaeon]|nr:MFS transporter [Candidatus Lokiarchaeota archaeon]
MFLPNPWVGKLSDKFNRKKVWLFSIPFFYIGMTFLFFAENLILLVPGIIFFNLNQVIGSISFNMHISANSIKTKKGLLFGLMFFSMFIGNIGGEFFVMLEIVDDIRVYFFLFMLIDVFNNLIVIFVISNPTSKKTKDSAITTETINKRESIWREIFKSPKKRAVLIFFTLDIFIYNVSLSIYGAGLRAQYGLT